MNHLFHLLQLNLLFSDIKIALLSFLTAFVVAMVIIPPLIRLSGKFQLFDNPGGRKEHRSPVPTMGGIAIFAGMMTALLLWFPFTGVITQAGFFFSLFALLALGMMDDMHDLSAKYKFVIQLSLALIIALSGIRITSLEGIFGIYELPLLTQYSLTCIVIVGITNAFNLIDGIDGLAGGLGFMSLVMLGIFLGMVKDSQTALIAFALAGGVLAFLYFNFNPARIFMGDTGSLVLGFVIAVLSIRFMQVSVIHPEPALPPAPVIVMAVVLIPMFDTLRVFATRIWYGKSPFVADRIHIHHLLTNQGFSHHFASGLICFIHAVILMEVYWLRWLQPEWVCIILFLFMLCITLLLKNFHLLFQKLIPAKERARRIS